MEKKRSLTKAEIEDALKFIRPNPYIPVETALHITDQTKAEFSRQLSKVKIYPSAIPELTESIRKSYMASLILPGECVGVITAQSIGEKQTQSNLNSVDWGEQILYIRENQAKVEPIGQIIDTLLGKGHPESYPESHTEYLDVKGKNMFIPSVDENGMCSWRQIEAVTRHFPEGKLVKVVTQSGRTVTATQAMSFLVWNGEKFVPTNGSEIKVGDILPTTTNKPDPKPEIVFPEVDGLTNDFGFFVGIYLAKGYISQTSLTITDGDDKIRKRVTDYCDKIGIRYSKGVLRIRSTLLATLFKTICNTSCQKKVPEFAYTAPKEFILGLLDGYFSGGGYVSESITVSSFSQNLIYGISELLSRFGIFGIISDTRHSHSLTISNGFARKFAQQISLTKSDKQKRLEYITLAKKYRYPRGKNQENFPIRDVYFDPIVSIELVEGTTPYVYDFTVEGTRNFQLWNGLNMRDTFHKAGSSDKQPTVSKFSEFLNATNKPKNPSFLLYFNQGNDSVANLRQVIKHSIVEFSIKKISKALLICPNKSPEAWYESFFVLYKEKPENFTDCISLQLDMNILFEYRITLRHIVEKIESAYSDAVCIFSPDCFGQIDVYFSSERIDIPEEKIPFLTEENAMEIYLEEVVQPILEKLCICGISGVNNMFYLKEGTEWIVETENIRQSKGKKSKNGSAGIMSSVQRYKQVLAHPAVNSTKSLSNNVWDIYHTFGIEAVRQYMIDEFCKIMKGINVCHIMLLVDKMTFNGTISSISRYTMRNDESGPFGKASFEETLDNFLKAGVFGLEEPTKGVSASIICGKRASIGTGLCDLTMDIPKLLKGSKLE